MISLNQTRDLGNGDMPAGPEVDHRASEVTSTIECQSEQMSVTLDGSEKNVEPEKEEPFKTADLLDVSVEKSTGNAITNVEITALNRSWSDINPLKWFSLTAAWSFFYSACVHPMYFATNRRQISNKASTVSYWNSIRSQFRRYGIQGVYRGFLTLFVGASVSEWLYLGVLEVSRENLPIESNISKDFISGALADVCSQVFYCPFGLIGNRQMAAGHRLSNYPYQPFYCSVSHILRTEGYRGLWVGLAPSLFLVPSTGVWWSIYGEAKRYLYARNDALLAMYGSYACFMPQQMTSSTDNVVHNSVAGAFAGLCITGLVNPVWVVRARMQVMPECPKRNIRYVVTNLLRRNGVRGFYRGAGMNASVYALESALFGTLYEYLKFVAQVPS